MTVGVLMALYALLPMLLAVAAGRFSDRVGVRRPMLVGTAAIAVGAALPVALPGLPALFASAADPRHRLHGVPGRDAERDRRARSARRRAHGTSACSRSAIRSRASSGRWSRASRSTISGFAATFALLAVDPLHPARSCSRSGRLALPGARTARRAAHHGGVRALLRHRTLRRLFAINALFAAGWDLHTVFVPIYGDHDRALAPRRSGSCCRRSPRRRSSSAS